MGIEYKGANPSEATIYCDPFQDEMLDSLRQVPGVSMVKGTTSIFAHTKVETGKKAVSDLDIDRLRPEYPPILPALKEHEVFLERTTASALKIKVGDDISVELESGRIRNLRVGGLGLMGTMSMNVLERTREIGVMCATGASDSSILGIVITESE